jgi:hypothetical protein
MMQLLVRTIIGIPRFARNDMRVKLGMIFSRSDPWREFKSQQAFGLIFRCELNLTFPRRCFKEYSSLFRYTRGEY